MGIPSLVRVKHLLLLCLSLPWFFILVGFVIFVIFVKFVSSSRIVILAPLACFMFLFSLGDDYFRQYFNCFLGISLSSFLHSNVHWSKSLLPYLCKWFHYGLLINSSCCFFCYKLSFGAISLMIAKICISLAFNHLIIKMVLSFRQWVLFIVFI